MNQQCPNCQRPNHEHARFCTVCGTPLGQPGLPTRTIALSTGQEGLPLSEKQIKTLVQRVQKTFGSGTCAMAPSNLAITQTFKREQTIYVLDISGSMGCYYEGTTTKLQAAVRAGIIMILEKARIDSQDEVGLVSFDDGAQLLLPLCPIQTHQRQMIQTLQSLTTGGGTDINEGLVAAQNALDWNTEAVRKIVLLTDGCGGHPLKTAERLKSQGVIIDVTGIGTSTTDVDENLLKKVASVLNGELLYRFIKDQSTLNKTFTSLGGKTRIQ